MKYTHLEGKPVFLGNRGRVLFVILVTALFYMLNRPDSYAQPPRGPSPRLGGYELQHPVVQVDDDQLAQAGIRKLEGKHLTLYTDLPSEPDVDTLPEVFDRCFPEWCDYFGVREENHESWSMVGFYMEDRDLFDRLGLMPDYVVNFRHGYCYGNNLWAMEQENSYRRRQLLIHEGTHGFMIHAFGSCGPPWYMEAIAEILSTYSIDEEGNVALNVMPASTEDAPYWGRIWLIRKLVDEGGAQSIDQIIANRNILENEDYSWVWALGFFLDHHPRYSERFRDMAEFVRRPDFDDRFERVMRHTETLMREEWQVFLEELEYGHDIQQSVLDAKPGDTAPGPEAIFEVLADKGWQNSLIRVEAGRSYLIEAVGRYSVDNDPRPWACEPNGVTLRYYKGQPYGMLLGAVRTDDLPDGETTLLATPLAIGLRMPIISEKSGTLHFRINESTAEYDDNTGKLTVRVTPFVRSTTPPTSTP
jgi:hypothetical protein